MTVVLDASAALAVALGRSGADNLSARLYEADRVLAPDLYAAEVSNAFWKYCSLGMIDQADCVRGVEFCLGLIDESVPTEGVWAEAFAEAVLARHPVYDLLYLVVARRNVAEVLTCDEKLKRLARTLRLGIISQDL